MATQHRHKRISADVYQALRNAVPVIVWYKKEAFKPYLRAALRDHPELLAGLDFDGSTKRETADELVERLIANEARYQKATIQLMLEIVRGAARHPLLRARRPTTAPGGVVSSSGTASSDGPVSPRPGGRRAVAVLRAAVAVQPGLDV